MTVPDNGKANNNATLTHILAVATRERVAAPMIEGGLDPAEAAARAHVKVRESRVWWTFAGLLFLVALAFAGGAFFITLKRDMTLLLAIVLGVFVLLPLLGAFFCANMASSDATKAFLSNLGAIGETVQKFRKTNAAPPAGQ